MQLPRIRLSIVLCAAWAASCSKSTKVDLGTETPVSDAALTGVQVGDHAIIENSTATFVEGTVTAIIRDRARVQLASSAEPIEEPIADLYVPSSSDAVATLPLATLPASSDTRARDPLREGSYAVCRMPDGRWRGCRIESAGTLVKVVDDDATPAELRWHDILAPTPVTELNVKQRFERNAKRRAFREGAKTAGRPRIPSGWRPALNEKVLAEREGGWMSAEVKGSKKSSVRIQWDSDHRTADTALGDLSPEPPIDFSPTVGIYVLARPAAGARAWTVMRVETAGSSTLELTDEVGNRFQMTARDVVPLERSGR